MKRTTFQIRIPVSELEAWRRAAKRSGMSIAAWVKLRCNSSEPVSATAAPVEAR